MGGKAAGGPKVAAPPRSHLGSRMSDDDDLSDADLRKQLVEARDKLRRELEILISPTSVGGGADNREAISLLQSELRQIETALANR
jgi:hypothetical protein